MISCANEAGHRGDGSHGTQLRLGVAGEAKVTLSESAGVKPLHRAQSAGA